jgi:hypothetical protein
MPHSPTLEYLRRRQAVLGKGYADWLGWRLLDVLEDDLEAALATVKRLHAERRKEATS